MAEQHDPVTHGELVEIVRRLDDRISSMDAILLISMAMQAVIEMMAQSIRPAFPEPAGD
ncbi:hypothetical protein [Candidatus Entotheonella palauensis]|uniref:Uncharacterized protein n=1 Tax=Candidatus Entotheonella gemina TaxID=1429439 RepID=W4MBU0_9BACT|nr:hypothetical protein [Candidatus Entotheonella palauensis]ETX07361.1 MAG: hypothetical protein ETSY2_11695 [Candidatus Entotheonella gemina]